MGSQAPSVKQVIHVVATTPVCLEGYSSFLDSHSVPKRRASGICRYRVESTSSDNSIVEYIGSARSSALAPPSLSVGVHGCRSIPSFLGAVSRVYDRDSSTGNLAVSDALSRVFYTVSTPFPISFPRFTGGATGGGVETTLLPLSPFICVLHWCCGVWVVCYRTLFVAWFCESYPRAT